MKRRNPGKGGGAMFTNYLENMGLLNAKKSYFETRSEWLKISKKNRIKDPKQATPEQLRAVREQLMKDRRFDAWIKFRAGLWTVIITLLFFSGFIYYMRKVFDF